MKKSIKRTIIFTDLDGTLLDHNTYSFAKATVMLDFIKNKQIPLIIVTSKTKDEVIYLQKLLRINTPFIVENGAGIFIPNNGDYEMIPLGYSYKKIHKAFVRYAQNISMHGFFDMSVKEISKYTSLDMEQAANAKKRIFTEPFILDDISELEKLKKMANKDALEVVKGGRFYHLITKGQDKAKAVRYVKKYYEEKLGYTCATIALGDSANDLSMLKSVDIPILIPHIDSSYLSCDIPGLIKAQKPGPAGWNIVLKEYFMANKILLKETFTKLLTQITPEKLIKQQCKFNGKLLTIKETSYDLSKYKNIYLLGSGKAVVLMAKAVHKILKGKITQTLIIGPYKYDEKLENCTYIQSTHPLPSEKSIKAAMALRDMIKSFNEEDLFIYLLSGGTSALVELPEANITLREFQDATSLMLQGGMPIETMNSVRKHLSQVKGGKLAKLTQAEGIVLVLSDVVGDDLHAIGSAPLYFDSTTFGDAILGLKAYSLFEKMPQSIQTFLEEGKNAKQDETPKKQKENIHHHLLGSNALVLQKAKNLFQKAGVSATIINKPLQGNVTELAKQLIKLTTSTQTKTHCYLLGGEPTVVVTGNGKGGRNQHLCLSFLSLLDDKNDVTFLSAATDGIDGNSNAAGAIIDSSSRAYAQAHKINLQRYLENFDSNTFFAKTGELIITGPTNNNLLDIIMILIEPKPIQGENYG